MAADDFEINGKKYRKVLDEVRIDFCEHEATYTPHDFDPLDKVCVRFEFEGLLTDGVLRAFEARRVAAEGPDTFLFDVSGLEFYFVVVDADGAVVPKAKAEVMLRSFFGV